MSILVFVAILHMVLKKCGVKKGVMCVFRCKKKDSVSRAVQNSGSLAVMGKGAEKGQKKNSIK